MIAHRRGIALLLGALTLAAACGGSGDGTTTPPTIGTSETTLPVIEETTTTGGDEAGGSDDDATTTVDDADPTGTTIAEVSLPSDTSSGRPLDGTTTGSEWLPLLDTFDGYVAERDIGAAVLAVSVDGEPVATYALGWRDLARTEALTVDTPFRLASVTKPYTRALALELATLELVELDEPVFCTPTRRDGCLVDVVDTAAAAGREVREEMGAITLRHLIDHTAGFDSGATLDPMFTPLLVGADLGLDGLPTEAETAAWTLGEPLTHTPGETYAYSNVGYLAAGLALENATGDDYLSLLRRHLDVGDDLALGTTRPAARAAGEVEYACDEGLAIDLFDPAGSDVCWADGGFNLDAMTAHGRLVAPASEVLDFLRLRCIDGLANVGSCDAWHDGSLSGTYTVARNYGRVDYVVLFNQRRDDAHPGFGYTDVVPTLDAAIGEIVEPFAG